MRRLILGLCAIVLLVGPVSAETYPVRPIRMIVGYSPGGGNDLIARIVAAKLQEKLGQPVIVDNRPGAQSIVAAEAVAKSPSDGYTLLVAPSGPMTINPAVYAKLSYSPERDFSPCTSTGPRSNFAPTVAAVNRARSPAIWLGRFRGRCFSRTPCAHENCSYNSFVESSVGSTGQ